MPILVQYANDWDEKYFEATKGMSLKEMDSFVYGLIGAVSPFLPPSAVGHCMELAKQLMKYNEPEETAVDQLMGSIRTVNASVAERQQEQGLFLVKR